MSRIETVSDNLERTTGGAAVLAFDMSPELIAESARVFIDIYGPDDTARFVKELQALVAPVCACRAAGSVFPIVIEGSETPVATAPGLRFGRHPPRGA